MVDSQYSQQSIFKIQGKFTRREKKRERKGVSWIGYWTVSSLQVRSKGGRPVGSTIKAKEDK